jgi:hypothetical protein
VSTVENREIAQRDVAAILQADRFVADAGVFRFRPRAPASAESFAPDQSRPENRNIFEAFAPDQAVVEMTVPEILIVVPWIRLSGIVGWAAGTRRGRIRRDNRGAAIEINRDFALQMNRMAEIAAGGKIDGAAAGRSGLDGFVHRVCVQPLPIARRAERADVEIRGVRRARSFLPRACAAWNADARGCDAGSRKVKKTAPGIPVDRHSSTPPSSKRRLYHSAEPGKTKTAPSLIGAPLFLRSLLNG